MRALTDARIRAGRDSGIALVVVIGIAAVLLVVVGTALGAVTTGLAQSNNDQSSTRALDAAYSGVQEYLSRLNVSSSYPQFGNPASTFSAGSSVSLPTSTNPAFGLGATGTWATVAGSNGLETYRYEVDNSALASTGFLRLRATGRFGSSTKSIIATIKQQGFISYLYFTNYETTDPQITGNPSTCAQYIWSGNRPANCQTIQFAARDTLNGPVRSNDTLSICGTTFNGPVYTANPNSPIVNTPAGCSGGVYNGGAPSVKPVLAMPATNNSMKAQTYSDTAANPGCLYTGPTQITLSTSGGVGYMNVVSPWTKYTNVTSTLSSGSNPPACGSISALHSAQGATVAVPSGNLVYVQSVPTAAGDPNYTSTSSVPSITGSTYTCLNQSAAAQSGSSGSAGWAFTTGSTTVRYPLSNEGPATNWNNSTNQTQWDTTTPAYGCRDGDAFVSGTLSGQMTIASDNYTYAIGDVLYNNPATDVLGLVSTNGVIVWNPMTVSPTCAYYGTTSCPASLYTPILGQNREIDAAILSTGHTFMVQNYDVGSSSRGTLTIKGSIAQNFRGTVATSAGGGVIATGYAKNYGYDSRFASLTPPYYLKPTSVSFSIGTYASTAPAFSSTGVAQ